MIEVRIPANLVPARFEDNDIQFGVQLLDRLRAAGIPAVGTVMVRGAETGRLEVEIDDFASDDWIWRWYP